LAAAARPEPDKQTNKPEVTDAKIEQTNIRGDFRTRDLSGLAGDQAPSDIVGANRGAQGTDREIARAEVETGPPKLEAEYSAIEAEYEGKPAHPHSVSTAKQPKAEYSVLPVAELKAEYSVLNQPRESAGAQVYDFAEFRAKLSTQSSAIFDKKIWKRSREKPGYLIKRFKGYNPVEDKYGVQYLYVLSRKPDRTSGDYSVYPFAGFFNWEALANTGLFVKERKSNANRKQK